MNLLTIAYLKYHPPAASFQSLISHATADAQKTLQGWTNFPFTPQFPHKYSTTYFFTPLLIGQ
jgi:hypothetical protein